MQARGLLKLSPHTVHLFKKLHNGLLTAVCHSTQPSCFSHLQPKRSPSTCTQMMKTTPRTPIRQVNISQQDNSYIQQHSKQAMSSLHGTSSKADEGNHFLLHIAFSATVHKCVVDCPTFTNTPMMGCKVQCARPGTHTWQTEPVPLTSAMIARQQLHCTPSCFCQASMVRVTSSMPTAHTNV